MLHTDLWHSRYSNDVSFEKDMQDLTTELKSLFLHKKRWDDSIQKADVRNMPVQDLTIKQLLSINEWLAGGDYSQFHKDVSLDDPNALVILREVAASWGDFLCNSGPVHPMEKLTVCPLFLPPLDFHITIIR